MPVTYRPLPPPDKIRIGLAHPVYRLQEALSVARPDLASVRFTTSEALAGGIAEVDVLVQAAVLWSGDHLAQADCLAFIQAATVGVDHFDVASLRARGVRLSNARGVFDRAVAEHAIGMMLMLTRQLARARDQQRAAVWQGRVADPAERGDELGGKTLLIVGLGAIGQRLARLAKAFDMTVIATRARPEAGPGGADETHAPQRLRELLPRADIVALCCPLTAATDQLIDSAALAQMRPDAFLINVARGRIVEEPALVAALREGRIAGAALDCFAEEPLPSVSPLWGFDNVVMTPHVAGETRRFEERLIALLLENLERLWSGREPINAIG